MRRVLIALLLLTIAASAQDDEWYTSIGQLDQVAKGLVGYYSFRTTGDSLVDEKCTNVFTVIGSPVLTYSAGKVGVGGFFTDATTNQFAERLTVSPITWANMPVTLSCWIKPARTNSAGIMHLGHSPSVGKAWGIVLLLNDSGCLSISIGSGVGTGAANRRTYDAQSISTSAWTHVAFSILSRTNALLWVNGNASAVSYSGTYNGEIGWGTHDSIARAQNYSASVAFRYMFGYIDEVRVHVGYALTEADAKQLYKMGRIREMRGEW